MRNHGSDEDIGNRLAWISEVVLKKFDNAERAFDTINNRAGLVIGWSGLLTASFLPALQRLSAFGKLIVLSVWGCSFACMIYNGYRAFSIANLKLLPIRSKSLVELTSLSSLEARAKLIKQIVVSSEINEQTCAKKAIYLDRTIKLFTFQLLFLMTALIVSMH